MALLLAPVIAAGLSVLGGGHAALEAQAAGACALLTKDDVQPLAPKTTNIADGMTVAVEAVGSSRCRYMWGMGADRYRVDLTTDDASRAFAGMSPEQIKSELQKVVAQDTADAVIPDVGEAAVFKADSASYVHAASYAKGRLLQVHVDGFGARDRKDQVIALLKTAIGRL